MKVGTLIRKPSAKMIGVVVEIINEGHCVRWIRVLFQNGKIWGCWETECVIL